jgi:hypothetical protein
MLGVGWLPHQPTDAFNDVLTAVLYRPLVIVIPSHILERVQFTLTKSLIIWDGSHELLYTITVGESKEMQSDDSFRQHVVLVRLHAFLLDPTLDISVLFTHRKRVLGFVLGVCLKTTLSVVIPLLNTVIDRWNTGARVYFRLKKRRWRWLRLRVCDVLNLFEVGQRIQFFN